MQTAAAVVAAKPMQIGVNGQAFDVPASGAQSGAGHRCADRLTDDMASRNHAAFQMQDGNLQVRDLGPRTARWSTASRSGATGRRSKTATWCGWAAPIEGGRRRGRSARPGRGAELLPDARPAYRAPDAGKAIYPVARPAGPAAAEVAKQAPQAKDMAQPGRCRGSRSSPDSLAGMSKANPVEAARQDPALSRRCAARLDRLTSRGADAASLQDMPKLNALAQKAGIYETTPGFRDQVQSRAYDSMKAQLDTGNLSADQLQSLRTIASQVGTSPPIPLSAQQGQAILGKASIPDSPAGVLPVST